MIIQCPSCRTKFSVESSQLAEVDNPRFHCSRCGKIFELDSEDPPAEIVIPEPDYQPDDQPDDQIEEQTNKPKGQQPQETSSKQDPVTETQAEQEQDYLAEDFEPAFDEPWDELDEELEEVHPEADSSEAEEDYYKATPGELSEGELSEDSAEELTIEASEDWDNPSTWEINQNQEQQRPAAVADWEEVEEESPLGESITEHSRPKAERQGLVEKGLEDSTTNSGYWHAGQNSAIEDPISAKELDFDLLSSVSEGTQLDLLPPEKPRLNTGEKLDRLAPRPSTRSEELSSLRFVAEEGTEVVADWPSTDSSQLLEVDYSHPEVAKPRQHPQSSGSHTFSGSHTSPIPEKINPRSQHSLPSDTITVDWASPDTDEFVYEASINKSSKAALKPGFSHHKRASQAPVIESSSHSQQAETYTINTDSPAKNTSPASNERSKLEQAEQHNDLSVDWDTHNELSVDWDTHNELSVDWDEDNYVLGESIEESELEIDLQQEKEAWALTAEEKVSVQSVENSRDREKEEFSPTSFSVAKDPLSTTPHPNPSPTITLGDSLGRTSSPLSSDSMAGQMTVKAKLDDLLGVSELALQRAKRESKGESSFDQSNSETDWERINIAENNQQSEIKAPPQSKSDLRAVLSDRILAQRREREGRRLDEETSTEQQQHPSTSSFNALGTPSDNADSISGSGSFPRMQSLSGSRPRFSQGEDTEEAPEFDESAFDEIEDEKLKKQVKKRAKEQSKLLRNSLQQSPIIIGSKAILVACSIPIVFLLVLAFWSVFFNSTPDSVRSLFGLTAAESLPPRNLSIEKVSSSEITLNSGERVLSIQGLVSNKTSLSYSGLKIEAMLYDEDGVLLQRKVVFQQNALGEASLSALKIESIESFQEDEGLGKNSINPNTEQNFRVVFTNLSGKESFFAVRVYSVSSRS